MLDNCEHLVGRPCATLADALLRRCRSAPRSWPPAASRWASPARPIWRVPSLAAAGRTDCRSTWMQLAQYEAVRLFVERAARGACRASRSRTQNAAAVAQICRRLDGIPLAIELAAARVRALSVEQIAARLDDRFRLLTGGSRTALPRQQTLRATVDWSYDLLSERRAGAARAAWRCSPAASTLEAAEAVCAGEELDGSEVLDLLARLVDKSLVVVGGDGGARRATACSRRSASTRARS